MQYPSRAGALPRLLLVLAALLLPALASAFTGPTLVKNINATQYYLQNEIPGPFVDLDGAAIFYACDGTKCGLWRSEGTAATTTFLKHGQVRTLVRGNGVVFFWIGLDLWNTDGTAAGTSLAVPGPARDFTPEVAATFWNGALYYISPEDNSFWKTDGTPGGTVRLKPPGEFPFSLDFTPTASYLYFHIAEKLWRTDGTEAGTVMLAASTGSIGAAGNRVVFAANGDDAAGSELWVSDGNTTSMVADLQPGVSGSYPGPFLADGSVTYFMAYTVGMSGRELWRTDGTPQGTERVAGVPNNMTPLFAAGGVVYYLYVRDTGVLNWELWRSDGTVAGNVLLGVLSTFIGGPNGIAEDFIQAGSVVYFTAQTDASTRRLWRTDGTPAGTQSLTTGTEPSFYISPPAGYRRLTAVDNRAAFAGFNALGWEPWTSDGTVAGTAKIADLNAQDGASVIMRLTDVEGTLYFDIGAANPSNHELWRTNGTEAGTVRGDILPGPCCTELAALGDAVFLVGKDGELYKWQGADVSRLTQFNSNLFGANVRDVVASNGKVYFTAVDSTATRQLWISDGTAAGTRRVRDASPAEVSFQAKVASGPYLYYVDGAGLTRTDGTAEGTVLLMPAGGFPFITSLFATDSGVAITRLENTLLQSLWKSDGTPGGTTFLANTGGQARAFTRTAGGYRFFTEFSSFCSLWKTDLTPAGTVGTGTIASCDGINPQQATFIGDRFAYVRQVQLPVLNYPPNRDQLWVSDGTPSGTIKLHETATDTDIFIARAGKKVYFNGNAGATGRELWVTDGTPAGTAVAAEVVPGVGSGVLGAPVLSGKRLYFPAQDPLTGMELYAITFNEMPSVAFDSATDVPRSAPQVPNPVSTVGSEIQVRASVTGGEYCVSSQPNCACDLEPFGTRPLDIDPGLWLCVRHVSSALPGTAVATILRLGSTSASFVSTTAREPTTATIIGFAPFRTGQPTTFTAYVNSEVGVPGGTVTFLDGPGPIAGCTNIALVAGEAQCTTTLADAGPHSITATYPGSAAYLPSTTAPLAANVVPRANNADLDNDGNGDLVFADAAGNIAAWTMNGTGVLGASGLLPAGSGWSVTHVADLNGDGKADLLLRHVDGRVLLWLMNGTGVSSQILLQPAATGWRVTHAGDLNGDGKADLLWEHEFGGVVYGWLMDGGTILGSTQLQPAFSGWHITHLADLNGDGRADILWQHTDGTTVAWLMNGFQFLGSAGFTPGGSGWSITHTGDVNGDGKADLVFRKDDGATMLWLMNGTTLLDFAALQLAGSPWRTDLVGDLDGDGKDDLVWRNTVDGSTYASLMYGTMTVSAGYLMGGGSGWTATHLRDLNGDGKRDILWRYTDGTLATWLMNGLSPIGAAGLIGPSTWQVVP